MLHGKDLKSTNIMDLKIGISTVTLNCFQDKAKFEKRLEKDRGTTSGTHGFKIVGYAIKDNGVVVDKFTKLPFKSIQQTREALTKVF